MARGWHYTKLSLSSALLLFFFWQVYSVSGSFFLSFLLFRFVVFSFDLVGAFCICSSAFFLSSRPRTGLATT